jgi:hypothetical protein
MVDPSKLRYDNQRQWDQLAEILSLGAKHTQ